MAPFIFFAALFFIFFFAKGLRQVHSPSADKTYTLLCRDYPSGKAAFFLGKTAASIYGDIAVEGVSDAGGLSFTSWYLNIRAIKPAAAGLSLKFGKTVVLSVGGKNEIKGVIISE